MRGTHKSLNTHSHTHTHIPATEDANRSQYARGSCDVLAFIHPDTEGCTCMAEKICI